MSAELVTAKSGAVIEFSRDDVDLIKSTICKGASDGELKLFVNTCKNLGLNPFAKQVFAVKRWDSKERREVMSIQISIDGFRLIAERTGLYAGQLGPYWSDGQPQLNPVSGKKEFEWFDAWPFDAPPKLAKVGVLRKDFAEPIWAVAKFSSYAQTAKDGSPTHFWQKMPEIMLGKCAESNGLRRAFPNELGGHYTVDEMGQAQNQIPKASEMSRLEKMIFAFGQLYTRQTGKPSHNIRYVLEDFTGISILSMSDTDFVELQKLYQDILTGKVTWDKILAASAMASQVEAPEALSDMLSGELDAKLQDSENSQELLNI